MIPGIGNMLIARANTAWTLKNPVNTGVTLDISAYSGTIRGVTFNGDGSVMMIADYDKKIIQYNLSIPYDVNSAVYFATYTHSTYKFGSIDLSDDGRWLLMSNIYNGWLLFAELTTPNDVTSWTFRSKLDLPSAYAAMNRSGTVVYAASSSSSNLFAYNLPTPYSLNGAVLDYSMSVSNWGNPPSSVSPQAFQFSPDESKVLFLSGNIYEYDIGTPGDLRTAEYVRDFDITPPATYQRGLAISKDGKTMLFGCYFQDKIYQFKL